MQKIKRNNTAKGFEIVKIQKIYNGVIFYENRTDLHKEDGFYEIVRPTLNENQKYGELTVECLNDATMEAVYPVIDIPPKTAQELYDAKMQEFEETNRTFIDKIVNANYEDVVLGETTAEFKTLIRQLKEVKKRIKKDLDTFLDNNDIDGLLNFSFNTDEAAYLDKEIKKFK